MATAGEDRAQILKPPSWLLDLGKMLTTVFALSPSKCTINKELQCSHTQGKSSLIIDYLDHYLAEGANLNHPPNQSFDYQMMLIISGLPHITYHYMCKTL